MIDLIDRSEVLYKFAEILPEADSLEWYEQAKPEEVKDLVDELYSIVLSVNRVDAQPVKHGRWIKVNGKYGGNFGCKCSNCGSRIRYANSISKISNNSFYWYCPKCGSKMDGGENDAAGGR